MDFEETDLGSDYGVIPVEEVSTHLNEHRGGIMTTEKTVDEVFEETILNHFECKVIRTADDERPKKNFSGMSEEEAWAWFEEMHYKTMYGQWLILDSDFIDLWVKAYGVDKQELLARVLNRTEVGNHERE